MGGILLNCVGKICENSILYITSLLFIEIGKMRHCQKMWWMENNTHLPFPKIKAECCTPEEIKRRKKKWNI